MQSLSASIFVNLAFHFRNVGIFPRWIWVGAPASDHHSPESGPRQIKKTTRGKWGWVLSSEPRSQGSAKMDINKTKKRRDEAASGIYSIHALQ